MSLKSKLGALYRALTKSPSNSGRSRKESGGTKKKKQNKGSRGSGESSSRGSSVSLNRASNGSNRSSGISSRSSESRGSSLSRSASSNRDASTNRKSTTTSRSGAIRPVGKAGVMGGNTSSSTKKSGPKITVNGKSIGPATKSGPVTRPTGRTNSNAPAYKAAAALKKGTDKKSLQEAVDKAKNTNALGGTKKTHTHKVDDTVKSTIRTINPRFHSKGGPIKETVKKSTYQPKYYDQVKNNPFSTASILEDRKAKTRAEKDFNNTERATKYSKEDRKSVV